MGLSIQQALVVASSGYEKGVMIASVFVYVCMWERDYFMITYAFMYIALNCVPIVTAIVHLSSMRKFSLSFTTIFSCTD